MHWPDLQFAGVKVFIILPRDLKPAKEFEVESS